MWPAVSSAPNERAGTVMPGGSSHGGAGELHAVLEALEAIEASSSLMAVRTCKSLLRRRRELAPAVGLALSDSSSRCTSLGVSSCERGAAVLRGRGGGAASTTGSGLVGSVSSAIRRPIAC